MCKTIRVLLLLSYNKCTVHHVGVRAYAIMPCLHAHPQTPCPFRLGLGLGMTVFRFSPLLLDHFFVFLKKNR